MLNGAEIGVDRGALSGFLLTELPQLQLIMVDTWGLFPEDSSYSQSRDLVINRTQEQRDADLLETMRVTEHARERCVVCKTTSEEAAKQVPDGSLDFVFLDADHSYAGVAADIKLWAPKIRRGGVLCGHDYAMEAWFPGWGVTQAVNEFAASIGKTVELGSDYTWFING
jgi:hypothetical protein